MSFKWANNSASIVLLPSESRYPQVHEQLKQWISEGLLGNFIWMTAEDINKEQFGPPSIRGTVWGLDEDRELTGIEVDAFEGKPIKTKRKTNRIGTVAYVPMQVSFMEYDSRILNLSE